AKPKKIGVEKGGHDPTRTHFNTAIHATLGSISCRHVRWCCCGDLWIPDIRSPRVLLWIPDLRGQPRERCRLVNNLASVVAGIYRWMAPPSLRGQNLRPPVKNL